jgi:large repetitive protein
VSCARQAQDAARVRPQASATTNAHILVSVPSPAGEVGVAYNSVAAVSGGIAPYVFSLASGTLPPGMTPNSRAGSISGVPTVAGSYTFVVSVSDSSNTEHGSGTARVSVGPAKVAPG